MNKKIPYSLKRRKRSHFQWLKLKLYCKYITKYAYLYLFKLKKRKQANFIKITKF